MSIKLTDKGNVYTLEYTKDTIRQMERLGFNIYEYGQRPITDTEQLFFGAFLSKHHQMKNDKKAEIFNRIAKKSELLGKLYSMYVEQVTSLSDEPEETEGNATWEEN